MIAFLLSMLLGLKTRHRSTTMSRSFSGKPKGNRPGGFPSRPQGGGVKNTGGGKPKRFKSGMKRGWRNKMRKSGSSIKQIRRTQRQVRRKSGFSSYRPYRPKSKGGSGRRRKL